MKTTFPYDPRPFFFPTLVGLTALCLYWYTLAPTVTGEDSGELIAAAYHLGVPHPPGYPVWTVLAHAFSYIPYGTVAWRVNLMSAVFAAATVFLLVLLLQRLSVLVPAAIAAACSLAFSHEFWEQAVIAEVYTLNLFMLLASLMLLLQWQMLPQDRWLYSVAFLFGLSLGVHNTAVLTGPCFALFVLWIQPSLFRRFRFLLALCSLAALTAFLAYLYLPLASLQDPPMDWGDPETPRRFWDVVTRKQYAFMFTQYPRSLERFELQVQSFLSTWLNEFTAPFTLLGLFGFLPLLRRHFRFGLLLMVVALITTLGSIYLQNPEQDREWRWVMSVFYLPAHLVTAIGIGFALEWGFKNAHRAVAVLTAVGCAVAPLVVHFGSNNKRDYYWAADYAFNLLTPLPPDAILVPQSDHGSFTATYLQAVEGVRPDVLIARKYGYLDPQLLANMPAELRQKIPLFPRRRDEPEVLSWLLQHTGRAVFFTYFPTIAPGANIQFQPAGLLYQALRPGEGPPGIDYWAAYRWHTLDPADTHGDFTAQSILADHHLAQAEAYFAGGETDTALDLVYKAVDLVDRDHLYLNNAGILCARYGCLTEAEALFIEALAQNPGNAAAKRNLEHLQQKLKQS